MKLYFRPMPVLTVVTAIALSMLVALGTWQYFRLQWKTKLLAEIEQVAEEPPFTSFAQIQTALENGEPIDFRRIGLTAEYVPMDAPFYVFSSGNLDVSWRVFLPVQQDNLRVFAALETVRDDQRSETPVMPTGVEALRGYVRLDRDLDGHTKSTPTKNRWFGFNPLKDTHNWSSAVDGGADTRFYIDTVPGDLPASDLPPKRPDIANNHFDYMLTWYGLAIVLLVIYLIMHKRAGRLRWS